MKQEIVIKVKVNGPKSRSKALQIAAGLSGVESAGLGGQDKSQIQVVGDGVDAVELVNLLRKKVGYAKLASVAEKKEVNESAVQPVVWPMYGGGTPQTYIYPIHPTSYY
ncbi:HEAVY METAL-ASSOCIATED ISOPRENYLATED PLANT PROTEIN 46 [Salix purpurea]|uniref:HEAVY METAL-ASSOCIATED ISOPRENYLATED PLANT PROTEIN 46 n=1 Tax=Salix purpurea TaxID=77065 RepID=A0A9Q0P308_SALPP|nr:HEAVY METAL-ASSOCIATED ISOPRENYLATED PLANT PROTEIN 46 [Salix purpurea]